MDTDLRRHLEDETTRLRQAGLFKEERVITSPQDAVVTLGDGSRVINLCANNYLGLANHPKIVAAAAEAVETYGYGMASVRFICGTQAPHIELERSLSEFLGREDTILYTSCFDANTGLFETLLGEEDAVISDALNHASIIDGIRLSKARRYRYANNDMDDLRACLEKAREARFVLIATDGVFSMDGILSNLPAICDLSDEFGATVMVDDSHAVGFMGPTGGGTPDHWGVADRVDLVTGTLGKALGGASGGYTSGRREIIGWLRQRSRPYLFSNSLPPAIAATSSAVLEILREADHLRQALATNAKVFRSRLSEARFRLAGSDHPIIPVMLGDARLAAQFADLLLQRGVYAIGFSFPVVPEGQARIRTQMSAGHTREQLEEAIRAFIEVGRELAVIGS